MSNSNTTLEVFCDGGFGNRYNALVSGFALAKYFGLKFVVHWPRNNWCQAGFGSIFSTPVTLSEKTLSELSGTLQDARCLLHDTLGADTLRVSFQSAYAFSSMDAFETTIIAGAERIFFYPALIPNWIPQDLIKASIIGLEFNSALLHAAKTFIAENFSRPYYGIHLRRTDLNVGLADSEVQMLVKAYPNENFFVCSDDPLAEALAAAHPNVHRRDKASNIQKKNLAGGWTTPTLDDDGRKYFSNIQRGAEAVVEGVIDILILGQSQIVGFSGSTFQNVARLLGQYAPIAHLGLPPAIRYSALQDTIRWMKGRQLGLSQVCEVAEEMVGAGRQQDAFELLNAALEFYSGADQFVILHNMTAYLIGAGRIKQAAIHAKAALEIFPGSPQVAVLVQRINEASETPLI